jgi:1-phosphofructokinase family hexose kinase
MILIITLNPLLERRFSYEKISLHSVNRNGLVKYQAGGKGINVSRQLKKLGIESYNLFFSGGANGKLFRDLLRKEGLPFTSVHIEDETRQAAIIISNQERKLYSFFSSNPEISESEIEQMKSAITKMITNCDIVVISGSSPSTKADELVSFTISEANRMDKVSVCDYYGENLEEVLNLAPTIIHNNFEEIEKYLGVNLDKEESVISTLNLLSKKGIKRVYLTNGENTFYTQNFDYIYKIYPPKINSIDSTGSGDAFVAGLIYCWEINDVFEHSLKFSTAIASANAKSFNVCDIELNNFESLIPEVKIEPIGKKIKLIDDSPTSH